MTQQKRGKTESSWKSQRHEKTIKISRISFQNAHQKSFGEKSTTSTFFQAAWTPQLESILRHEGMNRGMKKKVRRYRVLRSLKNTPRRCRAEIFRVSPTVSFSCKASKKKGGLYYLSKVKESLGVYTQCNMLEWGICEGCENISHRIALVGLVHRIPRQDIHDDGPEPWEKGRRDW